MIDAKTIEELRGLLAKATPGPWEAATDARQDQINEMRRAQSINPIPNQLSL